MADVLESHQREYRAISRTDGNAYGADPEPQQSLAHRIRVVLLAAALCASALQLRAEPRPLWELGIGATGFSLPDYRGADQSRSYLLPLPYLVYRGEVFRIGREGIRGILFESERAELDISLYGTPPVESDRNRARQGMPDLDPTFEVGPRLNLTLWRERKKDGRLELRLPLRAVFATDLNYVRHAGYLFYPHLQLDLRPAFLDGRWNLGLQSGPLYSTGKHHQYFYGVDPQFATAARPAYAAPGGYSGTLALASLSRRFRNYWAGAFVRYDSLQGAAFEDSPLLKRRHSVMAGVALAWIFARSARSVESDD